MATPTFSALVSSQAVCYSLAGVQDGIASITTRYSQLPTKTCWTADLLVHTQNIIVSGFVIELSIIFDNYHTFKVTIRSFPLLIDADLNLDATSASTSVSNPLAICANESAPKGGFTPKSGFTPTKN